MYLIGGSLRDRPRLSSKDVEHSSTSDLFLALDYAGRIFDEMCYCFAINEQ